MNSLSIYAKLEILPTNLKQGVSDLLISYAKVFLQKGKVVPTFGSAKEIIKTSLNFDVHISVG